MYMIGTYILLYMYVQGVTERTDQKKKIDAT